MIRIGQLKLRPGHTQDEFFKEILKTLKVSAPVVNEYTIVKRSIDARKKPDIWICYMVDVSVNIAEEKLVQKLHHRNVSIASVTTYHFPVKTCNTIINRPIIVGMGPAGLFCGYMLAMHGFRPIILERGEPVEDRIHTVNVFWETGFLNPDSNVQFGEGGAGTFSDGKLNTLVKDKDGRNREVLHIFAEHGAKESILYENKPHIGTDVLTKVVKNMRNSIIKAGGEIMFSSKVTDVLIEKDCIKGVVINGNKTLLTKYLILAIGHSARDTFSMLYEKQIPMEAKAFAVGLRVFHPQMLINQNQYGKQETLHLPAADYKLTAKTASGRGVYSFCMCPGGYVVNASSEEGRLTVNGMSYSGRDGNYANSAIIVSISPADFKGEHPLSGIAFQRELEEKAYLAGHGSIPIECFGDFKSKKAENFTKSDAARSIKGNYTYANLREVMPEILQEAFLEGMGQFNRTIAGFSSDNVLLAGMECRTSSPVRILRNESLQSTIKGLFPCGEGAGYAGGIMSAAMDGIRIAEETAKRIGGGNE